jgi:hypothetical protein
MIRGMAAQIIECLPNHLQNLIVRIIIINIIIDI